MQWVQSHIMGGRSSSFSQKGIFRGSSFTFVLLSSTISSILSSAPCLSNSASTLQVLVAAGLRGGVCDGGERRGTLETEVLGLVTSLGSSSSSCLLLRYTLAGRKGSLEDGGWRSACIEATMLKLNDKTEINNNFGTNPNHVTQKLDRRGWFSFKVQFKVILIHEHPLELIKNI